MSYLKLENGITDFSKAVISLWFRVPQSSIDAKAAEELPPPYPAILGSTIPLMTFGVPQTKTLYQGGQILVSVYHWTPLDVFGNPIDTTVPPRGIFDSPTFGAVGSQAVDPSYIGLDWYIDGDENAVSLSFNLQTAGFATAAGRSFNRNRVDAYDASYDVGDVPTLIATPGTGWTSGFPGGTFNTSVVDTSYALTNQPEFFLVQSSVRISANHWHHLLLSFDLDNPCETHGPGYGVSSATTADGTDSFCRLWYAIDDVNRSGFIDMGPFFVNHGDDPNAILTQTASAVADSLTDYPYNCGVAPATCSFGPSVLPAHGAELGIPASTSYLDRIYPVEMAELQVFTGVTLDTSIAANRRAFITADGAPADPLKKPNPIPPPPGPPPLKGPQELLGKEADILLHGSGNWINGKNTGKVIKLNEIGTPTAVPAAPFVPTGSIVTYSPDPSLHGAQSPPPPKPPAAHATVR